MTDNTPSVLEGQMRQSWTALSQMCREKFVAEASQLTLDTCLGIALAENLGPDIRREADGFFNEYDFTETNLAILGLLCWLDAIGDKSRSLEAFRDGILKLRRKNPAQFGINYLESGRLLLGLGLGVSATRDSLSHDDVQWLKSCVDSFTQKSGETKWQLLGRWLIDTLDGRQVETGHELSNVLLHDSSKDPSAIVAMLWVFERHVYQAGKYRDQLEQKRLDLVGALPCLDVQGFDIVECAMLYDVLTRLSKEAARLLPQKDFEYLVTVLRRFPQCLKRDKTDLKNEDDAQRILWTMLRAHYDDLVDEEYLSRFGLKNYRLDIGIRSLHTIVEVKFVRERANLGAVQDQLLADAQGYFKSTAEFDRLVIFIYDCSRRLSVNTDFVNDLKRVDTIADVIVVPEVKLRSSPKKRQGKRRT